MVDEVVKAQSRLSRSCSARELDYMRREKIGR